MLSPVISIIMPVFNDAQRISRCLKSLHAQTLKNIEIIIVNDGSTDTTSEVLQEYANNDDRIVLLNANRVGPYGCRNLGLEKARGQYIGFIDSDDWVEPEAFEEMVKPFENMDIDSTICSSLRFDESTGEYSNHYDYKNWPDSLLITSENIHKINGATWNKLYKRENVQRLGLRFTEYRMAADILFNWVYFLNFPRVKIIPEPHYIYTIRGGSIVTKTQGLRSLDVIRVFRDLKHYLKIRNLFKTFKNSYYELVAKSVGPRFMREKTHKIIFLLMTVIWIGPGLFVWGLKNFNEFANKIKR